MGWHRHEFLGYLCGDAMQTEQILDCAGKLTTTTPISRCSAKWSFIILQKEPSMDSENCYDRRCKGKLKADPVTGPDPCPFEDQGLC